MKAWFVWAGNGGEIHWAPTEGKAKMAAVRRDEWISADTWYLNIRARRAPAFDGEPRAVAELSLHLGYRHDVTFGKPFVRTTADVMEW